MGMTNFQDSMNTTHTKINSAYRMRKLKEIMSKTVKDLSKEPNCDALDYQDFKFIPGDNINIIRRKDSFNQTPLGITNYKVITSLDELIYVRAYDENGRYQNIWQKCDSDKLYFGDLYNNLDKSRTKVEIFEIR